MFHTHDITRWEDEGGSVVPSEVLHAAISRKGWDTLPATIPASEMHALRILQEVGA